LETKDKSGRECVECRSVKEFVPRPICNLASLSPKLSNSTPREGEIELAWIERHEQARLHPDILRAWLEARNFQLKFVYKQASHLEEIDALVESIGILIEMMLFCGLRARVRWTFPPAFRVSFSGKNKHTYV
jgi:hypothetical protein